jgi:hypothetical protein
MPSTPHTRILTGIEWLALGAMPESRLNPARAVYAAEILAEELTIGVFPGSKFAVKVALPPEKQSPRLLLEIGVQPDGTGLCLDLSLEEVLRGEGVFNGQLYALGLPDKAIAFVGLTATDLAAFIKAQGPGLVAQARASLSSPELALLAETECECSF